MSVNVSYSVHETGKNSKQWNLAADFTGENTLKDLEASLKQTLIKVALETKEEEEEKGFDRNARVRVDNKFDRDINTVSAFGKIEYFARFAAKEAILNIYKEIEIRSPVGATGIYKSSNYVIYNDRHVASSYTELKAFVEMQGKKGFADNDTIRFINVTPYARKLELKGIKRGVRGKSKGKKSEKARTGKSKITGNIIKKPNGAYYLAYRVARLKYKAVANFMKFAFLPGGARGITVMPGSGFRTTFVKDGRPYLYPTIVLSLNTKGIMQ